MSEKRQHKRVPYKMRLWCSRYHEPNGTQIRFDRPVFMDVFDLSLGGLGIICKHSFKDNSMLNFTLFLEDISYEVMAMVKWSSEIDSFYKHGVEIIGNNNMLFNHMKSLIEGNSIIKKTVI